MSNCYITSFSVDGYAEYGKDFVEGWLKHAPQSAKLIVYHEGASIVTDDPRLQNIDLRADPDLQQFLAQHTEEGKQGIFTGEDGKKFINYRFQATKFAKKVFAYTRGQDHPLCDWLIWIDADVEIFAPMPEFHGDDDVLCYYIGRSAWDHSECGFMAFNANHAKFKDFLVSMRQVYFRGDVFGLAEWHDSFVFDRVREAFEKEGSKFGNIAAGIHEQHPWPKTYLGTFSKHNKGPDAKIAIEGRKKAIQTMAKIMEGCKDRYEQINRVIGQLKPQSIVEFGTWNGERAISMAKEALKHKPSVHYIGFDLFEEANAASDSTELNVKRHYSLSDVETKLTQFAQETPAFTYELHKGNTRKTSHILQNKEIDFAFIDGGHSVETIQNDYTSIKHAKLILFDDYYQSGVDTSKYGCNNVVDLFDHLVLPISDKFGEMEISMVLAGRGLSLDGKPTQADHLNVKTKNCVEDAEIADNIRYSDRFTVRGRNNKIDQLVHELEMLNGITPIPELPAACAPNNNDVIIVGGAPSWKDFTDDLLASKKKIFATKSSHDDLIEAGIIPHGCFLLDPRDHVEGCMKTLHQDVIYYVASMCHPSTWDRLIQAKAKVVRYHAGVHAGEEKTIAELGGGTMIFGGTTSGMRGLNLLYMMGFRNFALYGFDSSYATKPDKHHGRSVKPIIEVDVNGRKFISDPELVAQSKDIEMFLKMMPDAKLVAYGDGMIPWAVKQVKSSDPGARNKVLPGFAPYQNALQVGDDVQEAYWIDNAIATLKQRRKKIIHLKKELASFNEFLNSV